MANPSQKPPPSSSTDEDAECKLQLDFSDDDIIQTTGEEETSSNLELDLDSTKSFEAADEDKTPLSSPSDQRFRALFGELFDIFDKKVDEIQEYRSTIHTLVKTLESANNDVHNPEGMLFNNEARKIADDVKQLEYLCMQLYNQNREYCKENKHLEVKIKDIEETLSSVLIGCHSESNRVPSASAPGWFLKVEHESKHKALELQAEEFRLALSTQTIKAEGIQKNLDDNADTINKPWDSICEKNLRLNRVEKLEKEVEEQQKLIQDLADNNASLELKIAMLVKELNPNSAYHQPATELPVSKSQRQTSENDPDWPQIQTCLDPCRLPTDSAIKTIKTLPLIHPTIDTKTELKNELSWPTPSSNVNNQLFGSQPLVIDKQLEPKDAYLKQKVYEALSWKNERGGNPSRVEQWLDSTISKQQKLDVKDNQVVTAPKQQVPTAQKEQDRVVKKQHPPQKSKMGPDFLDWWFKEYGDKVTNNQNASDNSNSFSKYDDPVGYEYYDRQDGLNDQDSELSDVEVEISKKKSEDEQVDKKANDSETSAINDQKSLTLGANTPWTGWFGAPRPQLTSTNDSILHNYFSPNPHNSIFGYHDKPGPSHFYQTSLTPNLANTIASKVLKTGTDLKLTKFRGMALDEEHSSIKSIWENSVDPRAEMVQRFDVVRCDEAQQNEVVRSDNMPTQLQTEDPISALQNSAPSDLNGQANNYVSPNGFNFASLWTQPPPSKSLVNVPPLRYSPKVQPNFVSNPMFPSPGEDLPDLGHQVEAFFSQLNLEDKKKTSKSPVGSLSPPPAEDFLKAEVETFGDESVEKKEEEAVEMDKKLIKRRKEDQFLKRNEFTATSQQLVEQGIQEQIESYNKNWHTKHSKVTGTEELSVEEQMRDTTPAVNHLNQLGERICHGFEAIKTAQKAQNVNTSPDSTPNSPAQFFNDDDLVTATEPSDTDAEDQSGLDGNLMVDDDGLVTAEDANQSECSEKSNCSSSSSCSSSWDQVSDYSNGDKTDF